MQEADMKRVLAVAVAVLMLMGPVYADGDFGSVGIAGEQTGVYPIASPGG